MLRANISFESACTSLQMQLLHFTTGGKKIHGPVTITIVTLYTVAFYVLTPEFAQYLQLKWLIAFDLCYLVMAGFLYFQIRKDIRKEMKHLHALVEIKAGLIDQLQY